MNLLIIVISLYFIYAIVSLYKNNGAEKNIHQFDSRNCLSLKGILAILIVVHHEAGKANIFFLSSFKDWGYYIVAVFFFITGYGLFISYLKKGKNYLNGFLKRRFIRLFPPYLICVSIFIFLSYMTNSDYDIVKSILGSLPDFTDILLPTSWFIVTIFLIYLFYYFLFRISKHIYFNLIFLFCLSLFYYLLLNRLGFNDWWTKSIFSVNIGMLYACFEEYIKLKSLNDIKYVVISAFVIFLIIYKAIPIVVPIVVPSFASFAYRYSIFCITIFPLFVVLLVYVTGLPQNKIMCFLGKISYDVYLVQGIIYSMLISIACSKPFVYSICVLTLSIICAFLLNFICKDFGRKNNPTA